MPADTPRPDHNTGNTDDGATHDGADDGAGDGDSDGELGYASAREELDLILAELTGGDLDVDVLAARVERASTLIEICRKRITNARIQVERVTAAGPDPAAEA